MHDAVFAFLQPDVPADERAAQGLQALLAEALNQQAPDKRIQLVYRGYELVPMARRGLGVWVHARALRWRDGGLAGITEGKECLMVLPVDAEPDDVVRTAKEACTRRGRIVEEAMSSLPDGWAEDVYPGQLLGVRPRPW